MNADRYMLAQQNAFRSVAQGNSGATSAPLRTCYVGAARCLTIVHMLDSALADRVGRCVIEPLRSRFPDHHWYPGCDLHITIKNVRAARPQQSFTDQQLQAASRAFGAAREYLSRHVFHIREVRRFPGSIVIGAFSDSSFGDAVKEIDRCLAVEGMADDRRYASDDVFFGSITVCRFFTPPTAELTAAVDALRDVNLGSYLAMGCALVECDEVCSSLTRFAQATVNGEV